MAFSNLTHRQISRKKAVIIAASLALLGGIALFLYGEWTTSVGIEGVFHYLFRMIGLILLGMSLLIFGIALITRMATVFRKMDPIDRKETVSRATQQILTAFLNVLVYGGLFLLAMGGLSALDGASLIRVAIVFVVWIFCVMSFIAYRRYRKKHKMSYSIMGEIGVSLLLLFLGAGMFWVGASGTTDAAQDLSEGPKAEDMFLVDAELENPHWRYQFIVQPNHVLTFYTADENRIVLYVLEADVDKAKAINDLGNFVHVTYYPRTQVFCEAQLWKDGRQAMGPELMARLHETYDLVLS